MAIIKNNQDPMPKHPANSGDECCHERPQKTDLGYGHPTQNGGANVVRGGGEAGFGYESHPTSKTPDNVFLGE